MKRIIFSVGAIMAICSTGFAGGDIAATKDVEPAVVVPVVTPEEEAGSFYVGAGMVYNRTYSTDSAWFDNALTQDETLGLTGILGYNFNQYMAVEGRISKSFWERDYADITTYSIFLKPQYPITEDISVYGLLGFGKSYVEGSEGDSSHYSAWPNKIGKEIMDETGFQWGFGLNYAFTKHLSLFADYTSTAKDAKISSRLYDYNGVADNTTYTELSTDGITVGLTYNF